MAQAQNDILIISGVKGDTRRYRAFHLAEQLGLAGFRCVLAHQVDPDLELLVRSARAVIFQRVVFDRRVARLLELIHAGGGLPILDTDDLTFDRQAFRWIDSPDFKDPIRRNLYQQNMDRNRLTLEACSAALTSTGYLAERIRGLGQAAWVHRNGFSLEMERLSSAAADSVRKQPGRVVIGYASGTPTHNQDFALIRTVLLRALERHPSAELWLLGPLVPGPGWETLRGRVRQVGWVPWRQLPGLLAQFDINLAPLRLDNPFSQSKSEIKWMEAALVGVPTIASPTDAFQAAIRPGQNGFLAGDEDAWAEVLENLLTRPECRTAVGRQARLDVLREFGPQVRAGQIAGTLAEILAAKGSSFPPAVPANQLPEPPAPNPADENKPGLLERAWYELRYRGAAYLLGQGWIFLRRLAAPVFPFEKS